MLKLNQKVYFQKEKLPYNVMAISENFAVVSRKLHRREDAHLLHQLVFNNAYMTFTDAFNNLNDEPVYSLLDFKNNVRASDNYIFGMYDYFDTVSCQKALKELESGVAELSERTKIELNIDFERTVS